MQVIEGAEGAPWSVELRWKRSVAAWEAAEAQALCLCDHISRLQLLFRYIYIYHADCPPASLSRDLHCLRAV